MAKHAKVTSPKLAAICPKPKPLSTSLKTLDSDAAQGEADLGWTAQNHMDFEDEPLDSHPTQRNAQAQSIHDSPFIHPGQLASQAQFAQQYMGHLQYTAQGQYAPQGQYMATNAFPTQGQYAHQSHYNQVMQVMQDVPVMQTTAQFGHHLPVQPQFTHMDPYLHGQQLLPSAQLAVPNQFTLQGSLTHQGHYSGLAQDQLPALLISSLRRHYLILSYQI